MARYSSVQIITTPEDPRRRYINVKYPPIVRGNDDIYVYTTKGDRYDLLALNYYGDTSLWWVIARSNANNTIPDSLYPNVGEQIRIPSPLRISTILGEFETLNTVV
jgi:hypothetical protein